MPKVASVDPAQRGCLWCPLPGERIVKAHPGSRYKPGGLMIVGEGPGAVEVEDVDYLVPFIGPTGRLLRKIIHSLDFDIEEICLANTIRCRAVKRGTDKDRPPNAKEMHACSYYLEHDIKKYKPKVIMALGNPACQTLIRRKQISLLRGCIHVYRDEPIFVVPSFHPSYLSRMQSRTKVPLHQFELDFMTAVKLLDVEVPKCPRVIIADTREKAVFYLRKIQKQKRTALDVEGPREPGKILLTIAATLTLDSGELVSIVFPIHHSESKLQTALAPGKKLELYPDVYEEFQKLLTGNVQKVGQTWHLYDRPSLEIFFKCRINNFVWDVMFGSYIWDERWGIHDLSMIASRFARLGGYDWKEVQYREEHNLTKSEMHKMPLNLVAEYNGRDAGVTHIAADKQEKRFSPAFRRYAKLYAYVSEPYTEMERLGVAFDMEYSQKLHRQYEINLRDIERKIRLAAGDPDLNINSQLKMGKLLFEKFKIHKYASPSALAGLQLKTKTSTPEKPRWATNDEVISRLNAELRDVKKPGVELLTLLHDYRDLSKDDGTFIVGLQDLVGPDGRMHVPIYLHGTDTGRASYRLHNIKKKFKYFWVSSGREFDASKFDPDQVKALLKSGKIVGSYILMDQIVAAPGYRLVKADNSQIELRVLGEMSQDRELLRAYRNHEDLHHNTACFLYDLDPDKKEEEWQRTIAKNCNFYMAFGGDEGGLYPYLQGKIKGFSLSEEEVRHFYRKHFKRFSGVLEWQKRQIKLAYKNGYVDGLFGRRRHLDMSPIIDKYGQERRNKHSENQSINTPIQGSAHDILLVQIAGLWEHRGLGYRILFEQHDAPILEVPEKGFDRCMRVIKDCMLNPDLEYWYGKKMSVPLEAEFKEGARYGSLGVSEEEDEEEAA